MKDRTGPAGENGGDPMTDKGGTGDSGSAATGMPPPPDVAMMPDGDPGITGDTAAMSRSGPEGGMMPGAPASEHSGSGPADRRPDRPRHQPALKAGEVDDNARWQEYLRFVRDYAGPPVHETNLSNRQLVTVLDQAGNPVPNASVTLERDGTEISTQLTYAGTAAPSSSPTTARRTAWP